MYRYDAIDHTLVRERVAEYRDQLRRHLAGQLSEDEFRPLRLRNGLYIQRHAPMLRIAIPYGLLSSAQLRTLAHIARRYDRGYGHFTTRQNIQFNWIRLEDTPDILAELAEVEMHAIQTSGNCVRNITSDEFAGVAPDEIVDPRAFCETPAAVVDVPPGVRLPAAQVQDRRQRRARRSRRDRLPRHRPAAGARRRRVRLGFRVLVGGGMGRTPIIGSVIREFLPWQHVLTYLEAILRVYNLHGRRDNIYKARIKILVKRARRRGVRAPGRGRVGARRVDGPATLTERGTRARRRPISRRRRTRTMRPTSRPLRGRSAPFERWVGRNVQPHQRARLPAVVLSLKKTGVPPGDVTADQMERVADLADRYSFGELRVSHEQNLILADVRARPLHALWQEAEGARASRRRTSAC